MTVELHVLMHIKAIRGGSEVGGLVWWSEGWTWRT